MKNTLMTVKKFFVWALVILAVCMMLFTVISVNLFDRTDRSLLGFKSFIVLSDSMSATDFAAGDLVISKEVEPDTLQAGDIITFTSRENQNYGKAVTHKIRRVTVDEMGNPGFVTYGTTTDTDDSMIVSFEDVQGQYVLSLPMLGKFFQFMKTPKGYICVILIPFILLIYMQGMDVLKYWGLYKKEQISELELARQQLEAEQQRLEAEHLATKRMYEELQQLKSQMAAQNNDETPMEPTA
jgi:signal peptidase